MLHTPLLCGVKIPSTTFILLLSANERSENLFSHFEPINAGALPLFLFNKKL